MRRKAGMLDLVICQPWVYEIPIFFFLYQNQKREKQQNKVICMAYGVVGTSGAV